jgi:alpha-glucosidase
LSITMLCNLGLSGVPFVGADIGGFWGDSSPELFARWIQAGVLYPLMRAHSHKESRPNEPWAFGPEVEQVAGEALALRYRLRPYLYTLFHEAASRGAPVLRPLLWEFPADARSIDTEDEVMLGAALLAAPVCHAGVRERSVYLPAGRWYDWWTGAAHDGPIDIVVDAPLDRLPMFGRGGRMVSVESTPASVGQLTLRVFPGVGAGRTYEDDGESFDYRHGVYALRRAQISDGDGDVVVRLAATEGTYRPPPRRILVELPDGRQAAVDDHADELEIVIPRRAG